MRKDAKTKQARYLRKNPTSAEQALWARLRRRQIAGFRFRRQHPIGPFIVDFACVEARLVIEVDGATHSTDDERARDAKRAAVFHDQGWHVIRAWNNEIYDNIDGVLETIRIALSESMQ